MTTIRPDQEPNIQMLGICWGHSHICITWSQDPQRSKQIPKDSNRFHKIPKDSKRSQKISKNQKDSKRFQKMKSQNSKRSAKIRKDLKRSQKIPKDPNRYAKIPKDKISKDSKRSQKIPQKIRKNTKRSRRQKFKNTGTARFQVNDAHSLDGQARSSGNRWMRVSSRSREVSMTWRQAACISLAEVRFTRKC